MSQSWRFAYGRTGWKSVLHLINGFESYFPKENLRDDTSYHAESLRGHWKILSRRGFLVLRVGWRSPWGDDYGVLDRVRRNVDFVDFWGVFPSVGREKIDMLLFWRKLVFFGGIAWRRGGGCQASLRFANCMKFYRKRQFGITMRACFCTRIIRIPPKTCRTSFHGFFYSLLSKKSVFFSQIRSQFPNPELRLGTLRFTNRMEGA
jgi:hypothetical protein